MKSIEFATAVEKFNATMMAVSLEHHTIGTRFEAEDVIFNGGRVVNPNNFSIEDMIEDCEMWAAEYGLYGCREIAQADPEERADYRAELRTLKKFIKWATANKDRIEPNPNPAPALAEANKDRIEPNPNPAPALAEADEYEIAAAESREFRDLIEKVQAGNEVTLWSERGIYGKESKVSYDAIYGEYVVVSGVHFGGRFKTERDLFKNLYTRGHIH